MRWWLVLALAACGKLPPDPRDPPPAQRNGSSAQCTRDDDCGLLPSALTCCVECPPAPPFEAAPTWMIDGALVEHETQCANSRRPCPELTCERLPEGCKPRAVCDKGRCVAVATGCERPTS